MLLLSINGNGVLRGERRKSILIFAFVTSQCKLISTALDLFR